MALFPAAGMAAPEGDATIQTDFFTVQPGQTGAGQAFCPSGSRVVGGGVTSGTPTAGGSSIRASGPLDQTGLASALADGDVGRSWYASVFNNASGPGSYVSTAICSQGSDATMRVNSFTLPGGISSGQGQPFCPSGSRVIGGGVTSTENTAAVVEVSGPLDETGLTSNLTDGDVGRSWYANVFGFGPNTYVSTAICSPGSDATMRVDSFTVPPSQEGDGQPFCPPDTRLVGGGVTSTGSTGAQPRVSGPLDETGLTQNLTGGDVGRSWYAYVDNPNNMSANTYASTAICAPPTSTTAASIQTCKGEKATIAARSGVLARTFAGTSNPDVIVGTSSKDKISAGAGNDLVCAKGGKDKVKGGPGKDRLFGQGGRDKLLGQAGKDLLSGGGRNDTCVGGPGKDTEKSC